jgi:ketosteroid isomerase-like protein
MPDRVSVVRKLYADFSRGDIPSVLSALAEDIEWTEPANGPAPFGGTHRGRDKVALFFQQLGETAEVLEFEPRELFEQGDTVIALGRYRFKARPTGKSWETDWAMVWRFEGDSVQRFQIYKDSAAEVAALRP